MEKYLWIIILVVIIGLLAVWLIATYNKLVKLRNMVKDQWSQIDVELKKRFDLVPNLVEIVKGYAAHEKDTFEAVVNARNNALSANTPKSEMEANTELLQALTKLFALSEAYPELKSDTNFLGLQNSMEEIENKIGYSRQFYNDTVLKYKNAIETFPTVLIASLLGFKAENFFTAMEEEKQNVQVKF